MSPAEETVLPFDEVPIQEQIGAPRRILFRLNGQFWNSYTDVGTPDYTFWDRARRGQAKGLELSGLFLKPAASKVASWVIGRPPLWQTKSKATADSLNDWWQRWLASIVRAYNESLDLGDCYIVFNGDSSLTVISPNMVTPIVDKRDPSRWLGWRIRTVVPDPNLVGSMSEIEDEYTATYRIHRVRVDGYPLIEDKYPNPLGLVPVVHIINRYGSDEAFGRPLGEPVLNALIRYGDVIDAALKGNIRQGRPTPVIEEMGTSQQILDFWNKYGRVETTTLPDGSVETTEVIDFDPDQLLTLGGTAKFRYAAPSSFTTDTQNLLNIIFFLIVQNSEIPEFIWGVAVGSSKASAVAQLEPFLKYIDKKRADAMDWINQLANIVVAYLSIYDTSARGQNPLAFWKPMTSGDGRLSLDTTIWAWQKGLIDDEIALWLLPVNLDNPKLVLQRARVKGANSATATPILVAPGDISNMPVPASKPAATPNSITGADQQKFPQENPLQPTERQMYERPIEVILEANQSEELSEEFILNAIQQAVEKYQKAATA